MIKALFFDLDGTLLNSEKQISPTTKNTLQKCTAKGCKLFIATARPPLLNRMLSWDKDTLGLFTGGSYYNGGCIIIGEHKNYVFIADDMVQLIINNVLNYGNLNIALQLEDDKHAFRFPLEDKSYKSWGVSANEALTLHQCSTMKTIKIVVFYSNLIDSAQPIDSNLTVLLEDICMDNAQFYLTDKGTCVQIMGKSVNKLQGIEKIRNHYGFLKNEIAVFGDDINDIEMLSEYPFSFAMGNAEPQVKSAAKYITLDNDAEGIHEAISNTLHLL